MYNLPVKRLTPKLMYVFLSNHFVLSNDAHDEQICSPQNGKWHSLALSIHTRVCDDIGKQNFSTVLEDRKHRTTDYIMYIPENRLFLVFHLMHKCGAKKSRILHTICVLKLYVEHFDAPRWCGILSLISIGA